MVVKVEHRQRAGGQGHDGGGILQRGEATAGWPRQGLPRRWWRVRTHSSRRPRVARGRGPIEVSVPRSHVNVTAGRDKPRQGDGAWASSGTRARGLATTTARSGSVLG